MAITQYYVDPSINANSGTGTIGDPFGDLQYALDTVTRDSSNGDQFNIKSGTAEVLTGNLSFASYGTPSATAPIAFRGYTSAANDGGKGAIDGNATYGLFASNLNYAKILDLEISNCGSAEAISLNEEGVIANCKIDTSHWARLGYHGFVFNNEFLNGTTSSCLQTNGRSHIVSNYFQCDQSGNGNAVYCSNQGADFVAWNIFTCASTTTAGRCLNLATRNCIATNNSFFGNGSNASGVRIEATRGVSVVNNIFSGFSNTTGKAIDSNNADLHMYLNNAFYDNTADFNGTADEWGIVSDNETLTADPFTKSGSNTYANRFTYFEPVDTGNIYGGAFPSGSRVDKGAVQHQDPTGGGGSIFHPLAQ